MPRYSHHGYWESTCVICWDMRELAEKGSDDYRYAEAILDALHTAGFNVFDHKQKESKHDTGNRE